MPATSLGTIGNWGVPVDEVGLLITDLSYSFSHQEKLVLDKSGEVQGVVTYQEIGEFKISGLVSKDSPFASKLGASLTIANAVPAHLNGGGGITYISQIDRTLNIEDFEKIDITAKYYPTLQPTAP